jgi:hypothetical protein
MRSLLWSAGVLLVVLLGSPSEGTCVDAEHLFFIERSKNKNIVQYDAHITQDGSLAEKEPVFVYWILENGERRELTRLQRTHAYGVEYQKKLDNNRYEIALTGLEERRITIKNTRDGYKPFVEINGKEAILEKLYIESEERLIGPPKVIYVDLFCRDEQSGLSMIERILPHKQT